MWTAAAPHALLQHPRPTPCPDPPQDSIRRVLERCTSDAGSDAGGNSGSNALRSSLSRAGSVARSTSFASRCRSRAGGPRLSESGLPLPEPSPAGASSTSLLGPVGLGELLAAGPAIPLPPPPPPGPPGEQQQRRPARRCVSFCHAGLEARAAAAAAAAGVPTPPTSGPVCGGAVRGPGSSLAADLLHHGPSSLSSPLCPPRERTSSPNLVLPFVAGSPGLGSTASWQGERSSDPSCSFGGGGAPGPRSSRLRLLLQQATAAAAPAPASDCAFTLQVPPALLPLPEQQPSPGLLTSPAAGRPRGGLGTGAAAGVLSASHPVVVVVPPEEQGGEEEVETPAEASLPHISMRPGTPSRQRPSPSAGGPTAAAAAASPRPSTMGGGAGKAVGKWRF